MSQRQPAYVESWDAFEFPSIDARTSSVEPPLFYQRVVLIRGIAPPGTPDAGDEVWLVVEGHQRVAKSMAECGAGDQDRMSDIKRWIREARAKDDHEKAWRRGREDEIAAHPDIAAALERSPEALYDRAGLSDAQRVAMRLFTQTNDQGEYKGYLQIGRELKISKDSTRDRIEAALQCILAIGRQDAG